MGGQTKIAGRGGQTAVTEKKVNFAQVGPCSRQMHGVVVAYRVRARVLPQTSALAGMGNGLADGFSAQRLVENLSWEQPLLRPYGPPIRAQQLQQLGRELDIAVLMTLALLNPDHHALAVDVGNPQMEGLADAHPGAVHGAEDHAVSKGGSGFQKPKDLFRTEDHGQPVFLLGSWNHCDDPILFQGDPVEKS